VSSFSALSLRKSLQPKEIKFGRHFLKTGLFLEEGAKALYGRDLRAPMSLKPPRLCAERPGILAVSCCSIARSRSPQNAIRLQVRGQNSLARRLAAVGACFGRNPQPKAGLTACWFGALAPIGSPASWREAASETVKKLAFSPFRRS